MTTLSILNGFDEEYKSKIIGFEAQIQVVTYHNDGTRDYRMIEEIVKENPEIIGVSPYIEREALLRKGRGAAEGVIVKGVDEKKFFKVVDVQGIIKEGRYELQRRDGEKFPGIIVGTHIAEKLNISIGDVVVLMSPQRFSEGFSQPVLKVFTVKGIFSTGLYEYDDTYAYIPLKSAQELFMLGDSVTGIAARIKDTDMADEVCDEINSKLFYPHYARTWFDIHNMIFRWMDTLNLPVLLVFSMIALVGVFNLVSTLIMIVVEKKRDIGILKSMGANRNSIMKIFLCEGIIIGGLGVGIGSAIGFALCWLQDKYKFFSLNEDIYLVSYLPVSIEFWDFLLIGSAALFLCIMATVYPAWRASKLLPTDAIRYE
ncbi:MAG: ABC transporter permease [Candidatus Helarchaeota archaeon]|nr:ABC transporter permease [Candidatus Helarchaeota archaeon]